MKSILVGNKKTGDDSKYPYLGIYVKTGTVVLFTEPRTGVVVHKAIASQPLGYFSSKWGESQFFEPLKGKITLHN